MDPLSIASGVAGLITLAEVVISRTYNTIIKCKNASEDSCRLLREVQSLLGILQSVSTLEKKLGSSAIQSQIPGQSVAACQKTLQIVRDMLEKADPRADSVTILQKAKRTLKWPISASKTDEVLADMERHKSTFNLAMTVDTLDRLLAASETQATTSIKVDQLERSLQRLVRVEMTKEARRMLQVLGADSADGYHRSNLQLHHPGTCLWFIDGSAFRDWCTSLSSRLWVSGIPGAGKTVLSALAIDSALVNSSKTKVVIFYYCSHQDDRSRLLTGILSCLIGQLARHNEECLAMVQAKFERSGHVDTPTWVNDESDLTNLLESMFLCFDEVSILIDGVDECHDASTVSETLARLCESPSVRMLISSRQEHDMKWSLADFQQISIAAESQDLRLYVPAEIEIRQKKQKLRIRNPDLKDEMIDKLVNGAQGMFRWVACQLDHLCNLTTDRERLLALETLPPTLYSTYDRILERLNEKGESACRLVERVLKWLISPAQGPTSIRGINLSRMTARELCVAISIDLDDTTTNLDDIPSTDEIMFHCGSFLRLSRSSRGKEYVVFAHFTVEEYLRSIDPREKPQLSRYRCDELNASAYVVETCLTFLNLDDFRPNLCVNLETIRELLVRHPFYARASVAWSNCPAPSKSSVRVLQLVHKLFSSPDVSNYDNWLQIRLLASNREMWIEWIDVAADETSSDEASSDFPSPKPTISGRLFDWYGIDSSYLRRSIAIAGSTSKTHIAAMFHLVDQIPRFFETETQLNALSPFGTTLHCALFGEVAIPMIMSRSDFAIPEVDEDTLSSTVSLLVQLGADVKVPLSTESKGIVTALYLAALSSATQLLLDAGAVLDESTARAILQDMDDEHELDLEPLAHIPLESVEDRDRHYVGQLLMRINPESNLATSYTTLWSQATILELEEILRQACQDNQLSVFRWIFENHRLDVNHRFRNTNESLMLVACGKFAADVVAYLVENGVEVNALGSDDLSPLEGYFTSRLWDDDDLGALSFPVQDCLATFRNIIDHRENLHGLTNLCDSALISWTKGGALQPEVQEQIVRVLLERGVDIAWRDSSGKNVWHYLASGSRIVKSRILKTCADFLAVMSTIDIADDLGFTPVLEAVEANDIEMFDFLIGQGCSVTSKTHKGESILHLSAAGIRSDDAILQRTLTKYTHTKIATSTFDGSTVAHYCVKFITEPDYGNFPPSRMPGLFKDAIEALEASSISTTETDSEGRTALDRLCQWIADHSSSNNYHCDVCLECFEVLVAHDDAVKTGVTWAAILLRGLALKAQSSDIHPAVKYSWESDNVCSRAVCLAIDRGVPLDDLGSDLDLDSIFDIAVQLREESLILKLLDIGSIDFDKPSRKEPHHTPLQSLCAHCCPASTIRVAISRTRDVCGSDPQGLGPLHMLFSNAKAQHKNMAPSIRALLDAGVDIDGNTNESGHTALMMAAASRISSDAVGTLLSSGAKVDLLNDDGWNALLYACAYGTESAIHELIDAGSAILHKTANLPDLHIEIPLCGPMQLAAGRGMSNIVQSLLQAERSVEKSDNNTTPTSPLLTACVGGDVETVRLLLEHGYDPNLLDVSLGLRPLHLASRAGDTQIVRALLDGGCDKEAPNKEGLTAWMLAMIEGRTDVADILERFEGRSSGQAVSLIRPLRPAEHRNSGSATNNDSGDSTHSRSMTSYAVHQPPFGRDVVHNTLPDGMRPFFEQGSLHVIEKFVKGGLDMEGRFKSCTCTPMLAAVIYDSLEIVEYLISIGVSLFTKDTCSLHLKYNDTVAELLAEGPVWTRLVEQYFRQPEWRAQLSQSSLFGMIACAIASGNFDTLDVLLDTVASPFPPSRITLWNILSSELLNQAAESTGTSAISCATMLLSRGLDVDHMDRNGSTPLQIAALYGHLDMITLFLSYGATLDVGTPVKCTALAIAAREGHVSIVNYLLASGAHPNFCLEPSISPVTLAAKNGEYVIFRALLEAGGTARAQDCYALCGSGYRSVLMLDEPYLCAMQGPDLLHYNCALAKLMPFLKVMPLARRALCFATLHPTEKITALYDAAIHGIVRFVDFALRYGAVINMEGGPEGTPLMAACAAGHASISKRLVRCGALLTYWNGTSHVSAFVKAQHHPKILRWLLAGRFTETLRLMENPSGEDLHLDTTVTTHGRANDVRVELILKHDIENYLERNFWFVSPRRFVDSGHGSFDELDILPSEFAKYKPGFV